MASIHIGTFWGIPIKIHVSFGLLILFFVTMGVMEAVSLIQGLTFGLFMVCLFVCVVLHELGHALAAHYYGVKTKDIILSPLGGVARLERLPHKPLQELVIAIAGPLVNVVLALIGVLILMTTYSGKELFLNYDLWRIRGWEEFVVYFISLNGMLFFFNLIPAFPMDGGRVLRALLAMKWGRRQATKVASVIGRAIAAILVVTGLVYGLYIQAMIGVFIFLAAGTERKVTEMEYRFNHLTAGQFAVSDFDTLHIGAPIEAYRQLSNDTGKSTFMVKDSLGYITGWIADSQSLRDNTIEDKITIFVNRDVLYVKDGEALYHTYQTMVKHQCPIVMVRNTGGEDIGIIDRHMVEVLLQYTV